MQETLEALDLAIASIAAQHNVVSHSLLVKIREFDERSGWGWQGYKSCSHYLSFRIGLSPCAAREHVRVAHALAKLPLIDAEMARGALSFSKARAITRISEPSNQEEMLVLAHDVSAAGLEKLVRGFRRCERLEDAQKREESRGFSCFTDMDGMMVLNARLLPE